MAIKDNRILIADGSETEEGTPPTWEQTGLGGGDQLTADTQTFYYPASGGTAITFAVSDAEAFIYWDAGSAQNYSNSEFYFLVQTGVIGDLVAAGLRFRFTGTTIGDWFEIQGATSSTWPATSVGKGWYQFVIDINAPRFNTGGTPPSPTQIQRVGLVSQIATMSRQDNTWIDSIFRRPYAQPGLIIEGTNGGNPYTWADVADYCVGQGISTFIPGPGGSYVASCPIQIGNTTTSSTHSFEDNNALILFDTQPASNADSYTISFVNTTGSTLNVKAGEKSGTGDAAVGSQGWTIQAAEFANSTSFANRWNFYANNNLANVALYGCTFNHGDVITFENANLTSEIISTSLVDCTELIHSSNTQYTIDTGTPLFQRLTIVNANTVDNQAFVKTVNPTNIKFSSFQFSNGHAMEISSLTGFAASTNNFIFTNLGFTGYSTANNNNDSTIFNNTGRAITINITGGDIPTVREGTGADTVISATVQITIVVQDSATNKIQNAVVAIYQSSDDTEIGNKLTDVNGEAIFSASPSTDFYVRVRKSTSGTRYVPVETVGNSGTDGTSITVTLVEDVATT